MCGRTRCTLGAADVPRACHRTGAPSQMIDVDRYRPSYNVGPGWNMPVVRRDVASDGDGYAVHCMKWGLVPSFTKKNEKPDFFRMFNARSESVAEKASFRRLLPKNRCLVAVEGFYEWKKDGSKKQPYHIHFRDGRPLTFAALYDSWNNSEGETLYTFTILTTSSSSALKWLHDRMPVILGDKEATDAWLNGDPYDSLLKPYQHSDLVWYPVTSAMGKIGFDGPECIKEVQLKKEDKGTISKFFVKKEVKEQEDPEPEDTCKPHEPMKKDLTESVKEEVDNEDKSDITPSPEVAADEDIKPSVAPAVDTAQKSKVKREFDDSVDENQTIARTHESKRLEVASPAGKKAKSKNDGDNKQPTLLSFFGKK
ncbi:unnamed protein product [Linum tenue]|uniref:Embryonic stem cell-specific 5-hydroxymethylcytosine-binding protein n=1 Tax=Linum tenue TaxID=586396 RepID=A0AAV0RT73_9ROSI|nr:unnamed protein product [Linum tenue]